MSKTPGNQTENVKNVWILSKPSSNQIAIAFMSGTWMTSQKGCTGFDDPVFGYPLFLSTVTVLVVKKQPLVKWRQSENYQLFDRYCEKEICLTNLKKWAEFFKTQTRLAINMFQEDCSPQWKRVVKRGPCTCRAKRYIGMLAFILNESFIPKCLFTLIALNDLEKTRAHLAHL